MGNCFSRQGDASQANQDNIHLEGGSSQAKTSNGNTVDPQASLGRDSSGNTQIRPQQSARSNPSEHGKPPPFTLTTKPLKVVPWTSKEQTWTRKRIDKERIDFFDTRLDGKEHIWQAIRSALEVLWEGGDAMDQDGGLATADTLLRSAGVILPKGDMCRGVYDESGYKYVIPREVISDPENLVTEAEAEAAVATASGAQVDEEHNDSEERNSNTEGNISSEGENPSAEEILRRKEEKGKGRAIDMVQVRARRNDSQYDIVVKSDRTENVAILKQRFTQAAELQPPSYIRLFFNGSELEDGKPLQEQGRPITWEEGVIITAMVVVPTQP